LVEAGLEGVVANGNGKSKKKKIIVIAGIGVGALLIGLIIMGFTRGGAKIPDDKKAKVEQGPLAKSVVATGKVEPITKAEIKSKASGIVKNPGGLWGHRQGRPGTGGTR